MFFGLSVAVVGCPVEDEEEEDKGGDENDLVQVLGSMVMAIMVKYWIYVCGGMFFFVSFNGDIAMYKIIYMMMFLFCVALYQVLSLPFFPPAFWPSLPRFHPYPGMF